MYLSKHNLIIVFGIMLLAIVSLGIVDRILLVQNPNSYVQVNEIYPSTKKWIGIGVQHHLGNQNQKKGIIEVIDVIPNSPAMLAGIKKGDLIKKVNGQDIFNEKELSELISKTPIGKQISIKLFRKGQNNTVSIKISKIPDVKIP